MLDCLGIIIVDSHTAVSLTSMVTSSSSHDPGVGLLQLWSWIIFLFGVPMKFSFSHPLLLHLSKSVFVFLSFGAHSLPRSHYMYILHVYSSLSLSLNVLGPSHLSQASLIQSFMFATPALANFFIPDLLNPLYSHHTSQHSHLCSFWVTIQALWLCQ